MHLFEDIYTYKLNQLNMVCPYSNLSYLIKIDVDRANVGCANSRVREESMLPIPIQHHSLIETE